MAVFVDLESDEEDSWPASTVPLVQHSDPKLTKLTNEIENENKTTQSNRGVDFSACLTCYPVAVSISSHLDLNDLHSLSLTCHSVHDSLTQYALRLKDASLRCTFNNLPLISQLVEAYKLSDKSESFRDFCNEWYPQQPLLKISACARDLVAECRKCGIVICRNCALKPPSNRYLTERHRRLCKMCLDAPLSDHLRPLQMLDDLVDGDPSSSSTASSVRSARSVSDSSASLPETLEQLELADKNDRHDNTLLSTRDPCSCETRGVYLCDPCGHNMRSADTTYKRVWTWRSRYSSHIGGGLGTGLGIGSQGQKCGRGAYCLDTSSNSTCWVEIDCSDVSSTNALTETGLPALSRSATPTSERGSGSSALNKPGYLQQEVEGIGGVVKKKVRKKVKTGATVWEFEDERQSSKYLEREAVGQERSWCSWCNRVSLGPEDHLQISRYHS